MTRLRADRNGLQLKPDMSKVVKTLCLALLLASSLPLDAAASEGDDEQLDAVHHVADGNYLDFSPLGKVQLPRIMLVRTEEGSMDIDFFGSTYSALASGSYHMVSEETVADAPGEESGASEDAESGSIIDEEEASGHDEGVLMPVRGELILDLSITRHLVFAWIGALLVIVIFVTLARRYQRGVGRETAPKGLFHNLFETLFMFVRDEIARPNLGEKTERFLPFLSTAFFFILFCNLLGLVPFGATATANISVTAVLAAFTFIITQVSANKDHWAHLFGPPGTPLPVRFILFPVEFLGLFTKPIALAIRLFANMTAGHLVILSLIGLIFTFNGLFGPAGGYAISPVSIAFSLGIYLLELLVATIQAYIFTMLSALFIGMAVADHGHHHEEEHHTESLPESAAARLTVDGITESTRLDAEPAVAS